MKAAVFRKFGPPENVKIEEVEKPVPDDNQVLVKVFATTVDAAESKIRGLRIPDGLKTLSRLSLGFSTPKVPVLGMNFSGVIEAVGSKVVGFKAGDAVVGSTGFDQGCHAEYVCLDHKDALALKPETSSHEEAVSVLFGGATVLGFFDKSGLKAGDHILINGASGAVGVAAVQIAKHLGAVVTGVCSGKNVELVKSLGADHVIDYTQADFLASSGMYDQIMDNVGNASFSQTKHLLKPDGVVLVVIFKNAIDLIKASFNKRALMLALKEEKQVVSGKNYRRLMQLAEDGALKPVIDEVFPFAQIAEAHRLADGGHKVGSAVVKIAA